MRYGKLSDGFGKHFARFLQSLGIKRDKIDFHSFRHTWTDACRNSRISSDVIYALKGEALKGTLARYGDGKTDLEILDEEIQKLRFKGLDLCHLKTSIPCVPTELTQTDAIHAEISLQRRAGSTDSPR